MRRGRFRIGNVNGVGNRSGYSVLDGYNSEFLKQIAVCAILVQRKGKGCGSVRSLSDFDALRAGFIRILRIEMQNAVFGNDGRGSGDDDLVPLNQRGVQSG